MRILIICILGIITFFSVMVNVVFVMTLWSSQANAAETGNLLSDNFADETWSGTNLQSRHGDGTIAGIDNQ
jgi:peroxiredoxin